MGFEVSKAVSAENTWTDGIYVSGVALVTLKSVTGILYVQVLDGDGSTWCDLHVEDSSATRSIARVINCYGGMTIRAGIPTGGYTSGTGTVTIKAVAA